MTQQNKSNVYRRLPRIKLHIPVSQSSKAGKIESIEKFTPDGFFLKTSIKITAGEVFDCHMLLPDSHKHIKTKLQAISVVEKDTYGVSTKIIEISDEDLLSLERTYLEKLGDSFSPHIAPLLNKDSYQPVFPFTDKKLIYQFINKLFERNMDITIMNEELTWITQGLFAYMMGNHICMFFTDTDIFTKSFEGEWLRVFIESGKDFFYFNSNVSQITSNKVIINMPEHVFSQGRRRDYRVVQDPEWQMTVDIPLPYPPGASIRREIIDISSNGLGFKLALNGNYFLPGTPLTNISIYRKDEEIMQTQAEVRHVTPFREGSRQEYLKVGVQFKIRSKRFSKGYMPTQSSGHFPAYNKVVKDKEEFNLVDINKLGIQKTALTTRWESEKIYFKNKKNEEIAAILDWTVDRGKSMPVIIISPALGKRKESTGLLASMLLQNFRLYGQKVAIIRYDGVRNVGESYNDIQCREPGKDMLNLTLSQYAEDVLSTLDFCCNNDYFIPEKTILISPSISAVGGRRALARDEKKRVHFWLCPMGVSHPRKSLSAISGGIDYFHIMSLGRKAGVASVLGCAIDWDNFWQDAKKNKLISVIDAKEDLSCLEIPILWIRGLYDAWILTNDINFLLNDYCQTKKHIIDVPTGHLPLNGQEAVKLFSLIISHIWHFLYNQKIKIFTPDRQMIETCLHEEWSHPQLAATKTPEKFWSVRLIKKMVEHTDDEILLLSKDYCDLIKEQCSLIDLKDRHTLADFGCIKRGLVSSLSEMYSPVSWHPTVIKMKAESPFIKETLPYGTYSYVMPSNFDIQHITCNIDFNSLLIIKNFSDGEFITLDRFKGAINGLTNYSVKLWKKNSSEHLFSILRGKKLNTNDKEMLENTFPSQEIELILDINRAARYIIDNNLSLKRSNELHLLETLKTSLLSFNQGLYTLPFESDSLDRIVCTLVLSYTRNPFSMFKEFYRILKKGGTIVFSLLKPAPDMSTLYVDMISHISQDSPESFLGNFNSDKLHEYVKESGNVAIFLAHFFGREPLNYFDEHMIKELCCFYDLHDVDIRQSYGNPSKALIVKAVK